MHLTPGRPAFDLMQGVRAERRVGTVPPVVLVSCVMWRGDPHLPAPDCGRTRQGTNQELWWVTCQDPGQGHKDHIPTPTPTLRSQSEPSGSWSAQPLWGWGSLPESEYPRASLAAQVAAAGAETEAQNQQRETLTHRARPKAREGPFSGAGRTAEPPALSPTTGGRCPVRGGL